jgi:hypothetical protein
MIFKKTEKFLLFLCGVKGEIKKIFGLLSLPAKFLFLNFSRVLSKKNFFRQVKAEKESLFEKYYWEERGKNEYF